MIRRCSRNTCSLRATSTLTFDYKAQIAVLGPLSPEASPGAYDLCDTHADSFGVPKGWEVVRLPRDPHPSGVIDDDDLFALADAVRAVGLADEEPAPVVNHPPVVELARRGHLRVIVDADEASPATRQWADGNREA